MSVRAKFKCHSILVHEAGRTVKFGAVVNDSDENKSWSKWTPSGDLTMSITNPDAYEQFEVGKCYFLDFSPVG